ncbi:MAG: AsmA-like C-terminal region-containing protein, partial [Desulfobacteraceae bacterium]|nr:AsmA-like C-terminal region-containing protein [Desulfobacteraceae bacterium]
NDDLLDGSYSFSCKLNGDGFKKEIKNILNGHFKFNAANGRIYKATLLSRLLSVLNISKVFKGDLPDITQEGFAYRSIVIEAEIENSIIYLKKALIDGKDMTLIFSGWVDPVKNQLNLTCLVAPLKTVDNIIKYIPIVNTLLDGRLMSFPAKATGKINDPKVTPLHPSAVGKGLIDMMSNIVKTPVKLIEKLDTN